MLALRKKNLKQQKEQTQSKVNRRKEITKIGANINKIEARKIIKKINKNKNYLKYK